MNPVGRVPVFEVQAGEEVVVGGDVRRELGVVLVLQPMGKRNDGVAPFSTTIIVPSSR